MAPPHQKRTEVCSADTPTGFESAVAKAASLLRAGELVGLPTETVYGLAANAFDPAAVLRIFELKGRPEHNPIIVHVASFEMARACTQIWPALADKLAQAFWPGPLTLVLPRSARIPDQVTARGGTVGIRWPSHPVFQRVIQECDFPLAAPSANPSNRVSPTTAEHVRKYFNGRLPLIIDGGHCQVGIESTVLDLSVSPPCLLRPGIIGENALRAVTGVLGVKGEHHPGVLKSPGQLRRHYAPKAKLTIVSWKTEVDLRHQAANLAAAEGIPPAEALAACHVIAHTHIPEQAGFGGVYVIPHEPEAFARALYAQMHHCDEAGARMLIIEALPETNEWLAVSDRLKRAAAA